MNQIYDSNENSIFNEDRHRNKDRRMELIKSIIAAIAVVLAAVISGVISNSFGIKTGQENGYEMGYNEGYSQGKEDGYKIDFNDSQKQVSSLPDSEDSESTAPISNQKIPLESIDFFDAGSSVAFELKDEIIKDNYGNEYENYFDYTGWAEYDIEDKQYVSLSGTIFIKFDYRTLVYGDKANYIKIYCDGVETDKITISKGDKPKEFNLKITKGTKRLKIECDGEKHFYELKIALTKVYLLTE